MPVQNSFVDFNICGTVPPGANYAVLAVRADTECTGCIQGKIDLALSYLSFMETGGKNLVTDPIFTQGVQTCGLATQDQLTIEPSATGDGQQLHFTGGNALSLNCPAPAFAVTPGAGFNATFSARISQASVGTGYFAVIFETCNTAQTCEVSRDEAPFQSTINGIALSQTGFTVQAVAGGGAPPPVQLSVLNGETTPLNFSVADFTNSGGTWLTSSPSAGVTDPNAAPPVITNVANPASLPAGTYYGQIQVSAPNAPDTPQLASVVLNVAPAGANTPPAVQPTGLVFTSAPGTVNPPAQSITLTELGATGESFVVTSTFSGSSAAWFTITPAGGSVAPNAPMNIQVQPEVSGLASGVYTGTISVMFPRESATSTIQLLLVIGGSASQQPGARSSRAHAVSTCTPTKLLPVFTMLGSNFTVPAAWPTAIAVDVVDDCGGPLTTGSVITTFSNGDPPLALLPLGDGTWTGTWAPVNAVTAALQVTGNAANADLKLQGMATVSGTLNPNAQVPVVSAGGIVNAGSFALSASPSPGELVSIFGANLTDMPDGASTLPLPPTLNNVSVVLGGQPLALLNIFPGQINAVIPFAVAPGPTQIVVTRNSQLSQPQTVQVQPAEPGVFTTASNGQGQGWVAVVEPDGAEILADANNPAVAGNAVVIYCSGLGAVTPTGLPAGAAAPLDTLYNTVTLAAVTIGGQNAKVLFSGLAPGFAGLYQINAVVPSGVTPGNSVPVVISVGGFGGPAVTMAVAAGSK
jgi:uncharacterized protein (TIGR03437 family)